ncbi:MAG: beta-N-acetylhexosaminidase [Pseudomonadales bacterium]
MSDLKSSHVLPIPQQMRWDAGALVLWPERFELAAGSSDSQRLQRALDRLNDRLAKLSGQSSTRARQLVTLNLHATQHHGGVPQCGVAEDYRLQIADTGVKLNATSEWGLLHGMETLVQLLGDDAGLPACEISDEPRFAWRGLLLDVARHYLKLETLKRTLDCMAAVKLNVLHLHLTDDQGFRFRSEAYPDLASEQAYSAGQLKDLVSYAADRGIRVVPELDVPGHVNSWLLGYPQWGTETAEPSRRFGVHQAALNPADESVYQALDRLFGELTEVFPDRYLHIGGDEVHPQWWQRSAQVQAYMAAHNLADIADLQAHFNHRLRELLLARERLMIVWDEALHPMLTHLEPAVVVQNWRGATTRDRALATGHPCLVSSGYYLDLHFPADWHYLFDPQAKQEALLAHEDALLTRPDFASVAEGIRWTQQWRADALTQAPTSGAAVLGGEACLWGELVDDQTLDLRLWTRLPAVAERFWSASSAMDLDSLYPRLAQLLERWRLSRRNDVYGHQELGLQAAGIDAEWQPLLAWFEPVKWYGRLLGAEALQARLSGTEMPKARPYQADTPLNQAIDHLPVESLASRDLAHAAGRDERAALQQALDSWRAVLAGNDCPESLQTQRQALGALAELVHKRLNGAMLTLEDAQVLQQLQQPMEDMLLAPAFALASWLEDNAS